MSFGLRRMGEAKSHPGVNASQQEKQEVKVKGQQVTQPTHFQHLETHLGFEESTTVVPDLGILAIVGGRAHRCCSYICQASSHCQIFTLGSVLDSEVHCWLK